MYRIPRAHAAMDAGLDEEFKRIVAEMKPHAKKLPQKSSEERFTYFLNIAHPIISINFLIQLNDTKLLYG